MAKKFGIIVTVFAVFYLGAHYWIRWRSTVSDDVTKLSRLISCDANDVRGIQIFSKTTKEKGPLRFIRRDNPSPGLSSAAKTAGSEWLKSEPEGGEADSSLVMRLATMACGLYDPIPMADNGKIFGAEIVEKISFDLQRSGELETHVLTFGPILDDRMILVKYEGPGGKNRVVKIPSKLFQLSSLSHREYLNARVMKMAADNVISAEIFVQKRKKFSLERDADGWRVIFNSAEGAKGSPEAERYMNRLATLRALGVQSKGKEDCVNSSSQYNVKVRGVGNREEALFFHVDKEGPLRVCNSERESLFFVHRDLLQYLDPPAKKLVSRR